MCITGSSGFQCYGHTRCATVKGDKGPDVAGVCVVESHNDCIEYHNEQWQKTAMREGSFHRLTPGLIEFIACAGTCTLSQTGLHECDTPTCRCVRLTRMYVCACTRVCVCVHVCVCVCVCTCVFLFLFLSLSLSLSLCMRARACGRRVVLCWVGRASCREGVRLHYHTTCHTHTHTRSVRPHG